LQLAKVASATTLDFMPSILKRGGAMLLQHRELIPRWTRASQERPHRRTAAEHPESTERRTAIRRPRGFGDGDDALFINAKPAMGAQP
jgi:hypothetical protein